MKNNTQDTIYISERNIIIKGIKGKLILKEDKVPTIGTPFVKPVIRNSLFCKEQKEISGKNKFFKVKICKYLTLHHYHR